MTAQIDPATLYSFAQAARLVPSPHAGKAGVSLDTLHRWRLAGRFHAEPRELGKRRYWFVWGSELLKLLPPPPPPPEFLDGLGRRVRARSQEERERAAARAAKFVMGG